MARLPLFSAFLCSLGCLLGAVGTLPAQDTQVGALLLKNGRLLTGQVYEDGGFYRVQVAQDSRVSIPRDQVQHVAADAVAIYALKCEDVRDWNTGDHFQMTRWCLANDLPNQAIEHYRLVAEQAADHPRVKQLAVELRKNLLADGAFRAYLGLAPQGQPDAHPATELVEQGAVEKVPTPVVPVSAASGNAAQAAMHPQIAAKFTQRIQPILLNRCSQAACHGALGKNALRITEPYRAAYARITSDNLRNVLAYAETDGQAGIPVLLKFATQPHGIQREAAIGLTETQLLKDIGDWLEFVKNPVVPAVSEQTGVAAASPAGMPAGPSGFTPMLSPGVALVPVKPGDRGLKAVPRSEGPLDAAGFPGGDVPLDSEIDRLDQQLRQILGEPPAPAPTTTDPFDPAEFNRQAGSP